MDNRHIPSTTEQPELSSKNQPVSLSAESNHPYHREQNHPESVILGVIDAARNFGLTMWSPYETLMRPAMALGIDGSILVGSSNIPELAKTVIPGGTIGQLLFLINPNIGMQAQARMDRRFDAIDASVKRFHAASGPERTRIFSEIISSALLPGYVFNRLGDLINVAKFSKPRLFYPTPAPSDLPKVSAPWEVITLQDIRNTVQDKLIKPTSFNYIITKEHELIIAREKGLNVASESRLDGYFDIHFEMANGEHVYAAGEVSIAYGQIIGINNFADYLTWGEKLGSYVEHVFAKHGLPAKNTFSYTPSHTDYKPLLHRIDDVDGTTTIVRPASVKVADNPEHYVAGGLAVEPTALFREQSTTVHHDEESNTEGMVDIPVQLSGMPNPNIGSDIRHDFDVIDQQHDQLEYEMQEDISIAEQLTQHNTQHTEPPVLSQAEMAYTQQFLRERGLSTDLPPQGYVRLHDILSEYKHKAAILHDASMKHQLLTNTFMALSALGKKFGKEDLVEFSYHSMRVYSMGATQAFASLTMGLEAVHPVTAVFTIGAYLLSSLSDENEAGEQVMSAIHDVLLEVRAVQRFQHEFAHYTHDRFNRVDRYAHLYFTQTIQALNVLGDTLSSALQYMQLRTDEHVGRLESGLRRILKIGQESLLEKFDEAVSLAELNEDLTERDFARVTRTAEFYLHEQAANAAFTSSLTNSLNKRISASAFTVTELENTLAGEDPFNHIAYLQQYLHYVLGREQSEKGKPAHPGVWLKAFDLFVKTNLRYPDRVNNLTQNKIKKLTASAQAVVDVCQLARENLPQFLADYKQAMTEINDYIDERFKSFNANNTALGIDISRDMEDLGREYAHSDSSFPAEKFVKFHRRQDAQPFNTYRITNHGDFMVAPHWVVPTDTQLDISSLLKELLAAGYPIPFEYILAEKIGKGKIIATYDMPYYYPDGYFKYNVTISYVDNVNPDIKIDIISVIKKLDNSVPLGLQTFDLYDGDKAKLPGVKSFNRLKVQEAFPKAVLTECRYLNVEATTKLNQQLKLEIFTDPCRNFAKLFLDPSSAEFDPFSALKDKVNVAYVRLISSVGISFSESVVPSVKLENGHTIQHALQTLQAEADLSKLNAIVEYQAWWIKYFVFNNDILNQEKLIAANSSSTARHPVETALRTAISFLPGLGKFFDAIKPTQPFPSSNKSTPPDPLHTVQKNSNDDNLLNEETSSVAVSLLDEVEKCQDEVILQSIETSPNIDVTNNQGESALDLSLKCTDLRKRNRLVMQLVVEGRAHACQNPSQVYETLINIREKGRDIFSDKDQSRLDNAITRFVSYHHLQVVDENPRNNRLVFETQNNAGFKPSLVSESGKWITLQGNRVAHYQDFSAVELAETMEADAAAMLESEKTQNKESANANQQQSTPCLGIYISNTCFGISVPVADAAPIFDTTRTSSPTRGITIKNPQLKVVDGVPTLQYCNADYCIQGFLLPPDETAVATIPFKPVFPSEDQSDGSPCKPIEFDGRQSIYCKGEKTSLVYTPTLSSPFQNLDGTIGLVSVGIYWASQLVSGIKSLVNAASHKGHDKKTELDPAQQAFVGLAQCADAFCISQKLSDLREKLSALKHHAENLNKNHAKLSFHDQRWLSHEVAESLEEWQHEINQLMQIKVDTVFERMNELLEDFSSMEKELQEIIPGASAQPMRFFSSGTRNDLLLVPAAHSRAILPPQNNQLPQLPRPSPTLLLGR